MYLIASGFLVVFGVEDFILALILHPPLYPYPLPYDFRIPSSPFPNWPKGRETLEQSCISWAGWHYYMIAHNKGGGVHSQVTEPEVKNFFFIGQMVNILELATTQYLCPMSSSSSFTESFKCASHSQITIAPNVPWAQFGPQAIVYRYQGTHSASSLVILWLKLYKSLINLKSILTWCEKQI